MKNYFDILKGTLDTLTAFFKKLFDFIFTTKEVEKELTREEIFNIIEPTETPTQELKRLCLTNIGKDISQLEDEFGCAESVSTLLKEIWPDFQKTLSTATLHKNLKADKRFKATLDLKPWSIIISPTGTGSGTRDIPNGHVGILGEGGKIYSNTSNTSKWEQNYTIQTWIDRYRVKGRYPIFLFTLI